ncbi:DUF292-domain-containing protein [Mycena floridula]|nr:DUF292-domain-containing protein [Mycena floridula]
MPPWNAAKAKVQLRISVQRLRTLQQKKEAQAKASRRDIAALIERGKIETSRIKVESIIHEDVYVELLELLELYCELLLARFGVLDQNNREPDPAISEGVCSIIYAAPRTELKELHVLRDILMHKYGREFSLAVMEKQEGVSDRVARKLDLSSSTPSPELVDGYMSEIAKGYGVAWSPRANEEASKEDVPEVDVKESPETFSATSEQLPVTKASEEEDGTKAGAAITSPTQDNADVDVDSFEALSKRFAALKKR